MLKLLSRQKKSKGGIKMAANISTRKGNVKNKRSHSLRATKTRQNLNTQIIRLADGTRKRISVKEKRTLLKNEKAA